MLRWLRRARNEFHVRHGRAGGHPSKPDFLRSAAMMHVTVRPFAYVLSKIVACLGGRLRGHDVSWSAGRSLSAHSILLAACAAISFASFGALSHAHAEPRHGLSIFGDLKYPAGFRHYEYVNPDAPKGGKIVTTGVFANDSFDSFNAMILKGDAAQGIAGYVREGISSLIYDSLMDKALDEPDSYYGLVAESADIAADGRSVTFKLRREAKFADGTPVTAADCVFTFTALKEKGYPSFGMLLRDVAKAVAVDTHTLRYEFSGDQVRDLPTTVAQLPILPKAFYDTRKFEETWLDKPLGSGPYAIGNFSQGTFVSYVRRPDYWARDLNVNRGRWNFDEIRFDYFRERAASFEGIKSRVLDLREDFTSRDWATGYDIAAVREGRLIRRVLPDDNPSGTQGFWINTRLPKFADSRVRRALDLAFDYEWTNKNIFYSSYKRTHSYFENSKLKATGKPEGTELALLEPFRDKLPASVFGEAYVPPVSDGSGADRKLLSEAAKLLTEAGFIQKDGKRLTKSGEPFTIEYLTYDPASERFLGGFVQNLQRLGIEVNIRKVDSAQYQRRQKSYEYDMLGGRFTMSNTPGPELKNMFGSEAVTLEGTQNMAGVKDPVVDALIGKVSAAKTREEVNIAARALDRVLRAGHYWVPNWYKGSHTIAFWDKFSWPEKKPPYERAILDTWWFDAAKAAKLKSE
jgi:microcin C transport system substrate-binding protein